MNLQAVPGSGKTTALLAKLLILEKHLPFEDGSGILVLSHTNAAVEEITGRIGLHCPRLFAYPNFVGTIQSFVNQFLAQPYSQSYLHRRLPTIDTGAYQKEIWRRFQGIYWEKEAGEPGKWLWARHIGTAQKQTHSKSEANDVCQRRIEQTVKDMYLDLSDLQIRLFGNGTTLLKHSSDPKYLAIRRIITETVRASGIISYEYTYHLARVYLETAPRLQHILARRFPFAFVDEMQDMQGRQYALLETMFSAPSVRAYQRVGDKNQAIYSDEVMVDEIWTPRSTELRLTGSQRLSPRIAQVVAPFATSYIDIAGRNTSDSDGKVNDLPPCAIVYDDATATDVIRKFCELIKSHRSEGKMPEYSPYPIRAIAWVKDERGLQKYGLAYQPEAARSKGTHSCLKDYVVFARQEDWQGAGLRPIHKKIMDGLIKVLHLEGIRNPGSRSGYFNNRSLFKYLSETSPEFYDGLRLKSFEWSRRIYAGKADETYAEIKDFVPVLLAILGKQLAAAHDFLNADSAATASTDTSEPGHSEANDNMYRCPVTGIEVHVGTVHSAKGETHTATLYLESKYQGKYESEHLKVCFQGNLPRFSTSPNTDVYKKQSLKMVYVGFSRPTHFLCFAVHKDRFDEATFRERGWDIQSVC
ncbi:MAG: UvrD-helicase domain-containing protein [Planctomycetota bacterium]